MDGNRIFDLQVMPWLDEQYQSIKNLFLNDKAPKAVLLNGAPGIGKTSMAFALAKCVLCLSDHQSTSDDVCGCRHCYAFSNNNLLPDLIVLGDDQTSKSIIKVDDIRELIDVAHKTSFSLSRSNTESKKVFIILNAENLNNSAANALLKILEAEDTSNYFILTSSLYYKLSITIASRCYKLNLSAKNHNNIVDNWLHQNGITDKQEQQLLLELSGFAPKKALYYYHNEFIEKLNQLNDVLENPHENTLKNRLNTNAAQIISIFTSENQFNLSGFFELMNFAILKLIGKKISDTNAYEFIKIINNYKKNIDNGVTIDTINLVFNILYKYSAYAKFNQE